MDPFGIDADPDSDTDANADANANADGHADADAIAQGVQHNSAVRKTRGDRLYVRGPAMGTR